MALSECGCSKFKDLTIKCLDGVSATVNDRPGSDYWEAPNRVFSFIHHPNLLRPGAITKEKGPPS